VDIFKMNSEHSRTLQRTYGSLIDPVHFRTLEKAIKKIDSTENDQRVQHLLLVEYLLHPALSMKDLLDRAWDVIDGKPLAELRLRRSLSIINSSINEFRKNDITSDSQIDTRIDPNKKNKRFRDALLLGPYLKTLNLCRKPSQLYVNTLVPFERFTSLAIATFIIADDPQDCADLFSKIEFCLRGLYAADGLLDAAYDGLRFDDLTTFNELLDIYLDTYSQFGFIPPYGYEGPPYGGEGPKGPPYGGEGPEGPVPPIPGKGGPPGKPLPVPQGTVPPGTDPNAVERWAILQDLLSAINWPPLKYQIDSVEPQDACPGDVVTIKGSGFGDSGKVCFSGKYLPICVEAESWTESEIKVKVPADARPGPISLSSSPKGVFELPLGSYGVFVLPTLKISGNSVFFKGGLPQISLQINGMKLSDIIAVPPYGLVVGQNETVTISWVCDADEVNLTLSGAGFVYILGKSQLSVVDSFSFITPSITWDPTVLVPMVVHGKTVSGGLMEPRGDPKKNDRVPVEVKGQITAKNGCGIIKEDFLIYIYEKPQLSIAGYEVTQGIQTYTIQGAIKQQNDIPTVENKDTYVRFYVESNRNGYYNDLTRVTGFLYISGLSQPLFPIDSFIDARPNPDRTEFEHTLNFKIPGPWCTGTKTFHIIVDDDELSPGGFSIPSSPVTDTFGWSWTPSETIGLRYVRVKDTYHFNNIKTTTYQHAHNNCEKAMIYLPSPKTDIKPAPVYGILELKYSMSGLWHKLWSLKHWWTTEGRYIAAKYGFWSTYELDQHAKAIWVAYAPDAVRGVAGFTYHGSKCAAADNSMATLAHEIGHCFGLGHIKIKTPGSKMPDEPYYNHPNGGKLLDVGFDPVMKRARTTPPSYDIMAYASNRWTSVPTWKYFLDELGVYCP